MNNPAKDAEGYHSPDTVLSLKLLVNYDFTNVEMMRVVLIMVTGATEVSEAFQMGSQFI